MSAPACVLLPPCVMACRPSVHVAGNTCWGRCPSLVRERRGRETASWPRLLPAPAVPLMVPCCLGHLPHHPPTIMDQLCTSPQPVPSMAHTCSPSLCWPNRSGPGCSPPFVGLSSHLPTQAGAPSCGRDLVFLCYLHSLVPVTCAHPSTAAGWEPFRHTDGVGQAVSAGPWLCCVCKQASWQQAACCCLGGLWCGVHITPGGVDA